MPPRDLWDANPVFQNEWFRYYLDLFVSHPELIGIPRDFLEDSEMTDEEYNEIVAEPTAFDFEEYMEETVSDCSDDEEGVPMVWIAYQNYMAEYEARIMELIGGDVPGSGTEDDPYDLTEM
jgi:hypothetical protein